MYVGLEQPRGDGERYVTPARAAAKETTRGDPEYSGQKKPKRSFPFEFRPKLPQAR